jgi:uracil-DNA glycosylase family protein
MADTVTATKFEVPAGERRSLRAVRAEAAHCTRCPLYKNATQTVFGEGPVRARVMMIGEQPGDREDLSGKPFVGPAGGLLNRALVDAGIDRDEVYVTNAVKHFKWIPFHRKRLHQKPNEREIRACNLWLQAEVAIVKPAIIVALGATAAQALMGAAFRVTSSRGVEFKVPWAQTFIATVHPSAILRGSPEEREKMFGEFVADLKVVAKAMRKTAAPRRAAVARKPALAIA